MNTVEISCTDENTTLPVIAALTATKNDAIIKFEKGRYLFNRYGCLERKLYPSNNKGGLKNIVFPIVDANNIVIDGNGSEFVFNDRIFPFAIQNSKNITLKNFSMDFSFPRSFFAEVVRCDDEGIEFKYDEKLFDVFIDEEQNFCIGKDKNGFKTNLFLMRGSERNVKIGYAAAKYVSTKESCGMEDELPAQTMKMHAEVLRGGILFLKYRDGSPKVNYLKGMKIIFSVEGRENIMIFADNSKNISLENINIFRGAGMGVQAQVSENITANKIKITPKYERGDIVSVTADAFHFVNCCGKVTLSDCIVEGSSDDALNVHGVYTVIQRVISNKCIEVRLCHYEQEGFIPYKTGDRIVISDSDSKGEKFECTVLSVEQGKDLFHILLNVDKEAKGMIDTGDYVENPDRMPEVLVKNCKITACPHIRVSGNKKIVLQNNKISQIAGIVINDLIDYWYESGRVNDVLIENNVIEDSYNGVMANGLHDKNLKSMHKNIVIKNNVIGTKGGSVLSAMGVDGLVFENNVIKNIEQSGYIMTEKCKNISIKNNKFEN